MKLSIFVPFVVHSRPSRVLNCTRTLLLFVSAFVACVLSPAQTCGLYDIAVRQITYESRSGSGSLIGWTEYTSPSLPPKAYRKKIYTGTNFVDVFADTNCQAFQYTRSAVYSGVAAFDPSNPTPTLISSGRVDKDWPSPSGYDVTNDNVHYDPYNGNFSRVFTRTTVTAVAAGTCDGEASGYVWAPGHSIRSRGGATATLDDEDTDEDAIARANASATIGTSGIAFKTSRGAGVYTFSFCDVTAKIDCTGLCEGDYELLVTIGERRPHASSGAFTPKKDQITLPISVKNAVATFKIPVDETNVDYTVISATLKGKTCSGMPGDSFSWLGSFHTDIFLGKDAAGRSAGYLQISSEDLSAGVFSLGSVIPALGTGTEVIRDGTQILRQVKAPEALADLIQTSTTSYEIRLYHNNQVGAQDPSTYIYSVTGSPYVTHRIENPDGTNVVAVPRLRYSEVRGSNTKVHDFSYDSSAKTWTRSQAAGVRTESQVITNPDASTTVTTVSVTDSENGLVARKVLTDYQFGWGKERTKEEIYVDSAGTSRLTTTYDYYSSSANDGVNYRHLKSKVTPSGFWERYTYDSLGRLIKMVSQYQNAVIGSAESLSRVVNYTYGTLADADGDTRAEDLLTVVETLLGTEVSRRYQIDWSRLKVVDGLEVVYRSDIRCTVAGAAWNAATNLVTKTGRVKSGILVDRPTSETRPDGTLSTWSYTLTSSGLTTTSYAGAANTAGTSVIDGAKTITAENSAGLLSSRATYDVASGLQLSSELATTADEFGRPTRIDYLGGTFELRTYACCGLGSQTDRFGIETVNTFDAFGRVTDVARSGITMHTDYDAEGRVLKVIRFGTDATEMVQQTSHYDLAGRVTWSKDALNRQTSFGEVQDVSGNTVKTTTYPGDATKIETFSADGSLLSVTGTASNRQLSYEYGSDADGTFTKEIHLGSSGETTEWVKTYTDFAGRTYKTVMADNATAQSYFNAIGQLVRQVDPDGVTALFAYNARGEQEITAVDLDGDGVIDFDGTDRITKTVGTVATRGTYTVQRSTTQVWETDGQETPTTVSISESAIDGLHSWQTVRGLTTSTVTVLDGSGGRTVTTTTPDNVQTVQVYTGNLLTSTTSKTAANVQLASVTYGYDEHHRLHTATDARNGATIYAYFADDQIQSVTTPDPDTSRSGAGYDPQGTSYTYDLAGRVDTVTQPDAGVVNTTYWPTGAVRRTWGSRTYPVEYTYDPQGRVKTLTTWQNFAGDTGKAVTTWNYDPARGLLQNKRYADNAGPSYTYKSSGRLLTRTWARTPIIATTYSYNAAGDLAGADYSDATPDVTLAYDRAGRRKTVTDGSGSRTLAYYVSGQLQDETYTAGLMNTLAINRTFDGLNRLHGLSIPSVSSVTYDYDAASRLQTVTNGANTATYAYVTNSPLVESVAFANAGTTRLTTAKTYDKLNRLATIVNTPSSAPVFSHAYTYNAANQRTRATREDNAYWNYAYDALGQATTGNKFLTDDTSGLGRAVGYT